MKTPQLNRSKGSLGLCLLSLFLVFSSNTTHAQAESPLKPSQKLAEKIQKAVTASGFKSSQLGLWVAAASEEGPQKVYGLNDGQLFIPASLSKLVTAAAILNTLHPGYKYKTEILSEAPVREGVLKGDIYLRGGGDPSFVSENMWFLVNELTRQGFTRIEGDIVVDDTRFDKIRFGDDRQSTRVDRAYDAPVGAMSFNWNSVNVFVRPGEKAGDPLKVFVDPENTYVLLRNEGKTSAKGRSLEVERIKSQQHAGDVIRVRGTLPLGSPEVVVYKSITEPDMWSGINLQHFLKHRGIEVKGKVRTGTAPSAARALSSYESKPLAMIVGDMSKFSNNYVAEMLIKNLAYEAGERPATMRGGIKELLKFLEKTGYKTGAYTFQNASGLTRENKLTPEQIGRLLEIMRNDFTSFPEFLTSLPIAGIDGTLKSRMKNSRAERWVRAKTGLLTGVVGLAGYAGRANGSVVSFAFVYNGSGSEDRARQFFDRLATILVED